MTSPWRAAQLARRFGPLLAGVARGEPGAPDLASAAIGAGGLPLWAAEQLADHPGMVSVRVHRAFADAMAARPAPGPPPGSPPAFAGLPTVRIGGRWTITREQGSSRSMLIWRDSDAMHDDLALLRFLWPLGRLIRPRAGPGAIEGLARAVGRVAGLDADVAEERRRLAAHALAPLGVPEVVAGTADHTWWVLSGPARPASVEQVAAGWAGLVVRGAVVHGAPTLASATRAGGRVQAWGWSPVVDAGPGVPEAVAWLVEALVGGPPSEAESAVGAAWRLDVPGARAATNFLVEAGRGPAPGAEPADVLVAVGSFGSTVPIDFLLLARGLLGLRLASERSGGRPADLWRSVAPRI